MSLDDVVHNYLDDPNNDETSKESVRSLMASHIVTGMKLQQQGLMYEAIAEFAKENNRPINSSIDAEIVQNSYWHIGMVYRKLDDLVSAKTAFQRAYEFWKLYHVGTPPHYDLAEILLEREQFDESIRLCQELLEHVPDAGTKELLAKALEIKKNKLE